MGDVIPMPKRPVIDKERQEFLENLKEKILKGEAEINTEVMAKKLIESGVLDD